MIAIRVRVLFFVLLSAFGWGIFGAAAEAQADIPVIYPIGGTYTAVQTVTISDGTAGATIYYTTDGTTPTTSSYVYSGPIPVTASLTIDAIAVAAVGGTSATATESYTITGVAGIINTVAGSGLEGFSGDGGPATSALFNTPSAAAVDAAGNFYIADTANYRIRKVTPGGLISTVAGTGTAGYSGDGGAATSAELNLPYGVAVDGSGNLYIADTYNNRIRKVAVDGVISTVAGNGSKGYSGDGGAATSAELTYPGAVALDGSGNLYIADGGNYRIRKVTPAGLISTVAGTGTAGYSGDGGPATSAELNYPSGVAVDASGRLYVSDYFNSRVRKVTPGGMISTVAGNGTAGFSGDGGAATSAELNDALGVAVDSIGNLYIADSNNQRIRMVTSAGIISTVAGNGEFGVEGTLPGDGDGGPATSAELEGPAAVAVDSIGNYYIVDGSGVRKVTFEIPVATPVISLPAGTYTGAQSVTITDAAAGATIYYTTDGTWPTAASTQYSGPVQIAKSATLQAVAVTVASDNFRSAVASAVYTLIQPTAAPVFSVPAGAYTSTLSVTITDATPGTKIYFTTDGTTPTAASTVYSGPVQIDLSATLQAVAIAGDGVQSAVASAVYTLLVPIPPVFSVPAGSYTSAQSVTITDATPGTTIYYTTDGTYPTAASTQYSGPIQIDLSATLRAVAVASGGVQSAVASAVYTFPSPTPVISPAAGSYTGVELVTITGLGAVYYTTDGSTPTVNSLVYAQPIPVTGSLTINAIAVAPGDNASAIATASYTISGVVGIISTVAGNDVAMGFSGDGGPATSADLNGPMAVALDAGGNFYIADVYNERVRKVTPQGIISTVAGNGFGAFTGAGGYSGDGGAATSAELNDPYGIAVDASGNIYIADYFNQRVRKVTPQGIISTFAGTGTVGFSGDGRVAALAELNYPRGVAVDASGNVYIVDTDNCRIRKVTPDFIISTVAGNCGNGFSGDGGAAIDAELSEPGGVAVDSSGTLYIADTGNYRIRKVTPGGIISTVAGNGVSGFWGDGGPATSAELVGPTGVAVDASGNLYIADVSDSTVREVTPAGIISTVAGSSGYFGFSGDGGFATNGELESPVGVAVDANFHLYIADQDGFIRKVTLETAQPGVAIPAFSVPGGTYSGVQSVSISSATPGATIYYTTNGSTPTTSSAVYSSPIFVLSSETLEAIAFANGYKSPLGIAAYKILTSFSLGTSPSSLTVNSGQSGAVNVSVTPINGFSSAVMLSCSGLPSGVTCGFSPATVTPSGAAVSSTLLTISAAATSGELRRLDRRSYGVTALAAALFLIGWRRRRGPRLIALLCFLAIGLMTLSGCSSGSGSSGAPSPTPQNYGITVRATSGTLIVNTTIALTLN